MNVLIIGGSGFISSRLVRQLLDRAHHVTMFHRGKTRSSFDNDDQLEIIFGDRDRRNDLEKLFAGRTWDVVVDMVAYHPDQSALIAAQARGKTAGFIHCSTVSVYMISNHVIAPITEDQDDLPVMPFWPQNPFGMQYGIDKRKCEQTLWRLHDDREFPVAMLRPVYVCGPGDPAMRDYFWIERIHDGHPILIPGSGQWAFQTVYVEDVARAFVRLIETPSAAGQAYNVAGEEIFSLREYLNIVADVMGRTVNIVSLEQDIFDRLGFSRHRSGDVFPFNVRRTAIFSLDRIKNTLSYSSTPFREWITRTIDWFSNHHPAGSLGYDRRKEELEVIDQLRDVSAVIRERLGV